MRRPVTRPAPRSRPTRAVYIGANAWIALGDRERALEWAARARRMNPDEPSVLYNVACIHSTLGEIEVALDLLEKAVDGGFGLRQWWENDPDMDPLRDHLRFKRLLEKLPSAHK